MANSLYKAMGPKNNILTQLREFSNSFKGDPRQQVQQLLNSGKISQSQYDQAVRMANQLQSMLGGKF